MHTDVPLSVSETAFAAAVSKKVVQHALARRLVRRISKKREAPLFSAAAFALAVLKHAPVEVGAHEQRALFDAFLVHGNDVWVIQAKTGTVSLSRGGVEAWLRAPALLDAVDRRVHLLHRMRERIESRPDILSGTPVFKGTRAPVERVGSLLARKDVTRAEVAEDYPQLSAEDLEVAELYVQLNPARRGRPPKRLKLRRV